jgi:DNA-binding CsgD family transcriptional regulator
MSTSPAARSRELRNLIDRIEADSPPILSVLSGAIAEHVGSDFDASYGLASIDESDQVTFIHASCDAPDALAARFRSVVAASRRPWRRAPERVPAAERNRVMLWDEVLRTLKVRAEDQPIVRDVLHPLGVGRQIRVVLCDGPSMLAFVGAFRGRGRDFNERERGRLRALVPALRRRLLFERQMGDTHMLASALECVLEQAGAPVLLVDSHGRVRHSNSAGKAWLASKGRAGLAELVMAAKGDTSAPTAAFDVRRLSVPGWPAHALVTVSGPSVVPSAQGRDEAAAAKWALTPRQREVFRLLSQGRTNKNIAATLGIAEVTVEVHVSAILRRAGAGSRAELIARMLGA